MGRASVVLVVAVVAVVLCAEVATAAPTVLLRHQWHEGDAFTWLVDVDAAGEVITRNLTQDPPARTALDVSVLITMPQYQTVEAVDADGNGTVATEIGTIEMDVTMPLMGTQHITLDMTNGQMTVAGQDQAMPEALGAFAGKPFRATISPRGEVLKSELPFDLADILGGGATSPLQAFKTLQQQPLVFPEQEIAPGYCWTQTRDVPVEVPEGAPELPAVEQAFIYRLVGFEDLGGVECARIEMLSVMDLPGVLELPMVGPTMAAPLQDASPRMGPIYLSSVATIWFDNAAGRVEKMEASMLMDMTQELEGSITVQDQQHDLHVQTQMSGFEVKVSVLRAAEG